MDNEANKELLSGLESVLTNILVCIGHDERDAKNKATQLLVTVMQVSCMYLLLDMPKKKRLSTLNELKDVKGDIKITLSIILSNSESPEKNGKAFEDAMRDVLSEYNQTISPGLTVDQKRTIRKITKDFAQQIAL